MRITGKLVVSVLSTMAYGITTVMCTKDCINEINNIKNNDKSNGKNEIKTKK